MTMTWLIRGACRLTVDASLTLAMITAANAADPIIGRATVIDGDTIEIRGQRIRLSCMDAFEAARPVWMPVAKRIDAVGMLLLPSMTS